MKVILIFSKLEYNLSMGYTPVFVIRLSYFIVFVLGLITGSFLNVVIYRIPKNQSIIINPPSHCPVCKTKLKWYDLIPVLSYILLKGKCRYCKSKISIQYPLVELATGLIFILFFQKFDWSFLFIKWVIFSGLLIVTGAIDLIEGVVPDIIVIPGLITGIIFSVFYGKSIFLESIYGLLFMAAFFLTIILLTKGGMGWGDLTFGAMIGSFLGFKFSLITLILSFIIGSIAGLTLIIVRKRKRKDTIPFGPFLSIAAFITSIYGFEILKMYFKFLKFP